MKLFCQRFLCRQLTVTGINFVFYLFLDVVDDFLIFWYIGMDELGLVLSGVTEGIIEGLVADDDSNSSDSDNSTPDEDNSAETGVTTAAAAAVVIMISASVAVILIQKKRMQNK